MGHLACDIQSALGQKEAARNQFFPERTRSWLGAKIGSGLGFFGTYRKRWSFWEGVRAIEQFVVEQLVGDLGEAVGGEDGNGEGEAVVGVVVRLGDGGGEALAKFNEAGEAQNTEVASGVVVKEEDFSHSGVCGGGLIAAAAGDFLENLFDICARPYRLRPTSRG